MAEKQVIGCVIGISLLVCFHVNSIYKNILAFRKQIYRICKDTVTQYNTFIIDWMWPGVGNYGDDRQL